MLHLHLFIYLNKNQIHLKKEREEKFKKIWHSWVEWFCFLIEFPNILDTEQFMAAAVVGGAALGAALGASFADLHDTVRDVLYKAKNFEPILTRLKSTLDRLAPIMEYAKQFDCPEGEETWGLIEQMKMGENLVHNFLKIRWWKLYLKFLYRRRLEKLDNSIVRFCSLVDSQIVPTIGAQMWERVQTYFPDFKLKGTSISFFFCVSNFTS